MCLDYGTIGTGDDFLINSCEYCINYAYNEEYDCYECIIDKDEDELVHLSYSPKSTCPYFRGGDDYTIVRKQN